MARRSWVRGAASWRLTVWSTTTKPPTKRNGRARTNFVFVMTGETKDRTVADAIRAALVEGDRYRIETTGAETAKGKRLPRAFTYELGREGGP